MARIAGSFAAPRRPPIALLAIVVVAALFASLGGSAASQSPSTGAGDDSAIRGTSSYAVVFETHTVPSGATWSVTIGVVTANSTGTSLTIFEPNGSYAFAARAATTPTPLVQNGSFLVNGSSVTLTLDWAPETAGGPAAGATASSAPSTLNPAGLVIVGLVLGVVIAGIVGVARHRSSRAPVPPPPTIAPGGGPSAPPQSPPNPDDDDPLGHML